MKQDKDKGKLLIRNSTAEFLIFTGQAGDQSIEARYEDETIWLSQKLMAQLFDVDVRTVSEHLKNIYDQAELAREATIRKFRIVQSEGKREVSRNVDFYNLDAIISVGYRVNSVRATQFRQWATQVLREFAIKGYVLDRKRMENGTFLGEDYFERLLEEIREIRLSERRFYQKITDIYATSVDYNEDAPTTKAFFAKVQNKLHFAIHGSTAAELIMQRADSTKAHMGLTSWEKAPDGKIVKPDVFVAKNYLAKDELESLKSSSKRLAKPPVVSQPDLRQEVTSLISSSPIAGLKKGIKLSLLSVILIHLKFQEANSTQKHQQHKLNV